MKVFVAVLALVAAAAAGVVDDRAAEPLPIERLDMPTAEGPLAMMESDVTRISLYSYPNVLDSQRSHEMGGMKNLLDGPVMVAFKSATEDKMDVYLLPYGMRHINNYNLDEVRPFVQFLNNGRQKAFLYLSAGSYLQVPEMSKRLNHINLPFYTLNTAVRIAEHSSPYPYVLIIDTDSFRGNSRVADLKELGQFSLENGDLKIVHDNYPNQSELKVDHEESASRSFHFIPSTEKELLREYLKPIYSEKSPIRGYAKPIYSERDLIRDYVKPVSAERAFIRDYVKPVSAERAFIRDYVKPVSAKKEIAHEYVKPSSAEKDLIRDYLNPIYTELDLIRDYLSPIYADNEKIYDDSEPVYSGKELTRHYSDYWKPVYNDKDLIHEYQNPINTEKDPTSEYLSPIFADMGIMREYL